MPDQHQSQVIILASRQFRRHGSEWHFLDETRWVPFSKWGGGREWMAAALDAIERLPEPRVGWQENQQLRDAVEYHKGMAIEYRKETEVFRARIAQLTLENQQRSAEMATVSAERNDLLKRVRELERQLHPLRAAPAVSDAALLHGCIVESVLQALGKPGVRSITMDIAEGVAAGIVANERLKRSDAPRPIGVSEDGE